MSQQRPRRVAYLGPAGTNSEEAAVRYAPDAQRLPFSSFLAVARPSAAPP